MTLKVRRDISSLLYGVYRVTRNGNVYGKLQNMDPQMYIITIKTVGTMTNYTEV